MIANDFSAALFWDIDKSALDKDKNARFIIERVLTRGVLNDWKALLRVYTKEQIIAEATQMRYLDKLTLQFCSTIFQIPKEQFRCYTPLQSAQQPWIY